MKKVLILSERNNKQVFSVDNQEQFEKVALSIISGRFKANWYLPPSPPQLSDLTKADLKSVPISLREMTKRLLENSENQKKHYLEQLKNYQDIMKCLKNKDGKLAITLLRRFQYRENENFEILTIQEEYNA